MNAKEEWLLMARACEQAERYEGMVEAMKQVISCGENKLNIFEQTLLEISYKNLITARKDAYQITITTQVKEKCEWEKSQGEEKEKRRRNIDRCANYKKKILEEMVNLVEDLCTVVDSLLHMNSLPTESYLRCLKMKGDNYAILAGISTGEQRRKFSVLATEICRECHEISRDILPPAHPLRASLAWKYSELCYEILHDPHQATQIAKAAFEEAIAHLEHLSDEDYKDTTMVMSILRDNYYLWTQEAEDGLVEFHA